MGTWIDFQLLREQLNFEKVLKHFGIEPKLNPSGQHQGICPLPSHPKGGNAHSFSANMKRKIWRCFTCGASGNILDFAVRMDGGNPDAPADVRATAVKLAQVFSLDSKPSAQEKGTKTAKVPPSVKPVTSNVLVNPPLDFELKNLDADHVYLHKRDLKRETIRHFGLGYCSKGMFAGRIAIPLHSSEGKLVGYCGQLTDEFDVTEDTPELLWPADRERSGVKHVFKREHLLYNAHRIKAPVADLTIVQDFYSAWSFHQAQLGEVVGLMSDTPSPEQSALILKLVKPTGQIWFATNLGGMGDRCAQELFFDLGQHRMCRWIRAKLDKMTVRTAEDIRKLRATK